MTSDFGKSLTTSILFHGAIFMLLFLKVLVSPNIPLEIRRAIRVDVVGLPDKIQELAPPAPAPAPVALPAPPAVEKLPTKVEPKPEALKPTVDLKAKKKDLAKEQKKAVEKLKAMEALEKIKSEVSEGKKQEKIAALLKGTQVNKGNSLTGLERIEFDRYFDQMENHLRNNWNIPQWLADGQLKAQALVALDENGLVIRKQLVKSSGNSIFDTHVLEAIDRSSPFPVPPDRLRGVLSARGVVFNFPEE